MAMAFMEKRMEQPKVQVAVCQDAGASCAIRSIIADIAQMIM